MDGWIVLFCLQISASSILYLSFLLDTLLSFEPVVPRFSINYRFSDIRPHSGHKRLSDTAMRYINSTAIFRKQRFSTDYCFESKTARNNPITLFSFYGSVYMPLTTILTKCQVSILLTVQNRDFCRFLATRFNF